MCLVITFQFVCQIFKPRKPNSAIMFSTPFEQLIAIALLSRSVMGLMPFLGCPATLPPDATRVQYPTQASFCPDICLDQNYNYAYFDYHLDDPICFCGDNPASISSYTDSQSIYAGCASGYEEHKTISSFDHLFCQHDVSLVDQTSPIIVNRFSECFAHCQNYLIAMVQTHPDSEDLGCFCGTDYNDGQEEACNRNAQFLYFNDFTSPSGALKKRQRERVERNSRRRLEAFCPNKMIPCNVTGVPDAFECLDTNFELESCGGCISGHFNDDHKLASNGVHCSSIPGVALGASTCMMGKCEIYACKKGWVWMEGKCEKI
ncbi:hypothetical protein V865_004284 [Kwoniella europaea PYCC6329]|uniref:Protein CPL1-like domain-containing protein n=1 Tax=Kwoniella europaea PYCC6329 TaxID=1423913 RepID=A0AAX4KK61_9TREE